MVVAFFPDSRTLLSGGTDRVIRRWNTQSGDRLEMLSPVRRGSACGLCRDPGAELFRACVACHIALRADEGPRSGPTLAGFSVRRIATLPGYNFSAALKKLDIIWTAGDGLEAVRARPWLTPRDQDAEQGIGSAEDPLPLFRFLERQQPELSWKHQSAPTSAPLRRNRAISAGSKPQSARAALPLRLRLEIALHTGRGP